MFKQNVVIFVSSRFVIWIYVLQASPSEARSCFSLFVYRWTKLQFIYIVPVSVFMVDSRCNPAIYFFFVFWWDGTFMRNVYLFVWQCHQSVECKFYGRDLHIGIIIMPFITADRTFLISHTGISVTVVSAISSTIIFIQQSYTNIYFSFQFRSDCRSVCVCV